MTKYIVMCIALILTAFLPGCDAFDELTDDTEKPQDGTVEGTVTLESATEHGEVVISVKGTTLKTTSQGDGFFQLPDVPKGTHSVSFELDGFVTADEEQYKMLRLLAPFGHKKRYIWKYPKFAQYLN